MTRTDCPDDETLSSYLRGELDEQDAARIEEHVAGCRFCASFGSIGTIEAAAPQVFATGAAREFTHVERRSLPNNTTASDSKYGQRPASIPPVGVRYRVDGLIARGGMGEVYRVYDLELSREVALKVIRPEHADRWGAIARFRREVALASTVTHPNVLRVYDMGEHEGMRCLSMQLVDGEDLADLLKREGRLPLPRIVRIFRQICEGVSAAHDGGVLHRDLKPRNVLVDKQDHVYVTDFGLARSLAGPPSSLAGTVLGTPMYMSPEQVKGEELDARSDVYSLGVILYELLTGQPPFRARSPQATMDMRLSQAPESVRRVNRRVPAELERIVVRCLEIDPAARYPTVRALIADLDEMAARRLPREGVREEPRWTLAVPFALLAASMVLSDRAGGSAGAASSLPPDGIDVPATAPLTLHVVNHRRVTFEDGCQRAPAFVPDGRSILYSASDGDQEHIYRLTLDGGQPVPMVESDAKDRNPAVSPRGDRFAFTRTNDDGASLYVAWLDQRSPPQLVARASGDPSWADEGAALWTSAGSSFTKYDADSFAPLRTVQGPRGARSARMFELRDGSLLARLGDEEGLAIFPPEGEPRWLLREDVDKSLTVTPDERHALVALFGSGDQVQLMDVPLDGSPVTSMAYTGIMPGAGLALSRDGSKIAWSTCLGRSHVDLVDANGKTSPALAVEPSDIDGLTWVPGGRNVSVVSARTGKYLPWVVDPAGQRPIHAVPVSGAGSQEMAFSTDAKRFLSTREGVGLEIGYVRGDGPIQRLTSDPADSAPAFRTPTQAVFTRHLPDGRPVVMAVGVEGGEPVAFLDPGTDRATPSRVDGRVAYLACPSPTECVPMMWDPATGLKRRLSPALAVGLYSGGLAFSLDGRRVAAIRGGVGLVEVDAFTGAVVRQVKAGVAGLYDPTYTPDGLMVLRVTWEGNVWIADASL